MYAYICIYTNMYMFTYTFTCIYIYTHIYTHIYIYMYMYTYTNICICIPIQICLDIYVCIYTHIHKCIYIHLHIHIHIISPHLAYTPVARCALCRRRFRIIENPFFVKHCQLHICLFHSSAIVHNEDLIRVCHSRVRFFGVGPWT